MIDDQIASENFVLLQNLPSNTKLMVDKTNNKLFIDDRWFNSIRRFTTGDSRNDIIQPIKMTLEWASNYNDCSEVQSCIQNIKEKFSIIYPDFEELFQEINCQEEKLFDSTIINNPESELSDVPEISSELSESSELSSTLQDSEESEEENNNIINNVPPKQLFMTIPEDCDEIVIDIPDQYIDNISIIDDQGNHECVNFSEALHKFKNKVNLILDKICPPISEE